MTIILGIKVFNIEIKKWFVMQTNNLNFVTYVCINIFHDHKILYQILTKY